MINEAIIESFAGEECKPRVLVVTDMGFSDPPPRHVRGFSLAQFIKTIEEEGTILGQKAIVTKANIGFDDDTDVIENFKFDHPENGLSREKYDVCFIFPFVRDGSVFGPLNSLDPGALDAITRFMEAGGGIFATGDHEDLGAGVCGKIIRVNKMRKWTRSQAVPSAGGPDRLSTMLPGDDELYVFADESDSHPQRVYLNREKTGYPHPLMQAKDSMGNNVAIVHIPDHPHEGECLIPSDEELKDSNEWPIEIGKSEPVKPEVVAKSMSHGGILDIGKAPLEPREFIAIAAYDGHRAGVGRVVTDATWHHFLDINIDGTSRDNERRSQERYGLQDSNGNDLPELVRLRQHWRNLAEWLMPQQHRRRCAAIIRIAVALPDFMDEFAGLSLGELGRRIKINLDIDLLPYQVNDLLETVLAMGISDPVERKKASEEKKVLALGALTAALFELESGPVEDMLAKLEEAVAAALSN